MVYLVVKLVIVMYNIMLNFILIKIIENKKKRFLANTVNSVNLYYYNC